MVGSAQAKVLRVLQSGEFTRVGGEQSLKVDVRVVAATNRDLQAAVAAGEFREDLYFRLNVVPLRAPALRDRAEDVPLLCAAFVDLACRENGMKVKAISEEAVALLAQYPWPGNVRELRNVIERACVLSKGDTLNLDDVLGGEGATQPALGIRTDLPFKEAKGQLVELFEREYIVDLMKRHKMNLSAAAREAQIDRKHLRELIRKYGLDPRGDLTRDEN
jgi:two-component system, NtrC family, nitrogen regulation response regulator NtrX